MRILFVGDVMGSRGRDMIKDYLPQLKTKFRPQVTIVNGENAAGGRGITEKIYKGFLQAGADVVTMGNHVWDNRDIFDFIDSAKKMVRPANFPEETTPGLGFVYVQVNQLKLAVINLQGNALMGQSLANPFHKADRLLKEIHQQTDLVFIDFHAETTAEKEALAWYLDGQISALVGTHTHVQTNDARILPNGTAYLTDAGMTGAYDAILGVKPAKSIERFLTQMPTRYEVKEDGRGILSGCFIEIDDTTGRAKHIEPVLINADHPFGFEQ
ncbi:TIGR00282 family metallophosphoesterase [Loigolactobacillus backii]|uniref:Metallophosphoesterase n=1 Tax=Loigolactobacillus backii TaxID=375175 RepID=A0A192H2K9_9LACO|nr:TIGR00282 family metallophosphoesterase [Loigolactobacillus backii]ANK59183.1 metallophosphoesterase [Loigolactobacillus backii]ANK62595.1 metallophosphoesterase [Loigolactobacillus backii]ANK64173.1 metallophosphoesterase [Loigolactobacillus backii]ANK67432.1 metallophosphoesterase [Loigolactobacillus backii]ANK70394.1 metallophosphoesterase [Loigolactobacillus backii]